MLPVMTPGENHDMTETAQPAEPQSRFRRIIAHPGMRLLIAFFFTAAAAIASHFATLALPTDGDSPLHIVKGAVAAAMFVIAYIGFNHLIERRRAIEIEPRGALAELGLGLFIGVALFSAIVGLIAAGGGYRVIGTHPFSVLYPATGVAIVSGFSEEIIFRGFFFRIVEEWLGSWAALALSALLFGAAHLGNPGATLLAGSAIAIEAGVMLAALYMVTRRLWPVIGLHAAWNFTQGGIFGIAVSGTSVDGVLRPRIAGPELLTGGAFGAEASIPAIIVGGAFGIAMLVLAHRRGRFIAPSWVRRRQGAAEQL